MVTASSLGVLDTSVLIAEESGRQLDVSALPDALVTTVVTVAELELGVLAAEDSDVRARRLASLNAVAEMQVLPVTNHVAHEWARLRLALRERRRSMNVNDLWIAAIATAHELPIVTQDADFDALDGIRGVTVIRV